VIASNSKKSESSLGLNQSGGSRAEAVKAIEQEFNKGKLKEKHLMSWLNQILIEYCFES
jgi:hypothetical protein